MRETPRLSFRAQSLDNSAPDPTEKHGRSLEADDQEGRQELVQHISQVSISGTQVFSEGFISAFRWGKEFILEVPSEQRDSAGRIAPIICSGHISKEAKTPSWPDDVVEAIQGYARKIGRSVSDETADTARRGIEAVLKKNWCNRLLGRIKELLIALWKKMRLAISRLLSLISQSLKRR